METERADDCCGSDAIKSFARFGVLISKAGPQSELELLLVVLCSVRPGHHNIIQSREFLTRTSQ